MVDSNILAVQGFCVDKVTVNKDKVKIDLLASKEDLSGNIGDILASLEAHSTSEHPVDISLVRGEGENSSYSVQGFIVNKVMFSTEKLKVSLESEKEALVAQEGDIGDILSSLGVHASSERELELIVGRCDA